jgi:aspartate-semialdehyde dehydrogenase
MKKIKVGILGATGMVGQRFIQLLENHPGQNLSRKYGRKVEARNPHPSKCGRDGSEGMYS